MAAKTSTKKTAKKTTKKAVKKTTAKKVAAPTKVTVPSLNLSATGGQSINLTQMEGKKVVLYFYPKDMTPGCTVEGHEFTRLQKDFTRLNAVVFGVSRDSMASHEKFKTKECYTIDLISDADEKLCKAFKVIKDKNMYGRIVKGIERSTFVINEKGEVEQEWRGVKAEGHAAQVLAYLKS
jgi:peroxiredoxin Q/BCP